VYQHSTFTNDFQSYGCNLVIIMNNMLLEYHHIAIYYVWV